MTIKVSYTPVQHSIGHEMNGYFKQLSRCSERVHFLANSAIYRRYQYTFQNQIAAHSLVALISVSAYLNYAL